MNVGGGVVMCSHEATARIVSRWEEFRGVVEVVKVDMMGSRGLRLIVQCPVRGERSVVVPNYYRG